MRQFQCVPKTYVTEIKESYFEIYTKQVSYPLALPLFNLNISNQGFSLASAIGHSPKIVPDVREFAVQFGQFVRDDFQKCILYGNAQ